MSQEKYVIKVGRSFDDGGHVTVTIERLETCRSMSWKAVVVTGFLVVVFGSLTASVAYGYATGNYTHLLGLIEAGRQFVTAAVQVVVNGK